MNKMKKTLLLLAAAACLCACGPDREHVLKVYNWSDYMDVTAIDEFEQWYEEQTGEPVKVILQTFDVNETMLSKIEKGQEDFDVVCPSDYIIERMLKRDLLLPIDRDFGSTPDYITQNESPFVRACFDKFEGGGKNANDYAVGYMWGTVGILYNTKMVDEEVDSWDILWNEKYKGQIWQYDSIRDALAISLLRLGYDMNSKNPDEIAQAKDELIKQIPLLKGCGTDNIRSSMMNNKAALAVIYAGDAILCMEENEDLAYVIPKEGSNVWFDNVVIPKTAKNVEAAHAFINFLNDANLAARNTEFIYYSTPNEAAMNLLDEYFTENEVFNPSDETLARCSVYHDLGSFIETYNAAWSEFKSAMGN